MMWIFLAVIVWLLIAAGLLIYASRGPIGYEDEKGFHFGDEPNPFRPEDGTGHAGLGDRKQASEISHAAYRAWYGDLCAAASERGMRWAVNSVTADELSDIYQCGHEDILADLARVFELACSRRL